MIKINNLSVVNDTPLFIKNIHYLMKNHNVTEAALARATDIPQPTLHKILSGKTSDPRISTLSTLADYFDVPLDKLLHENTHRLSSSKTPKPNTFMVPIIDWCICINEVLLNKTIRTQEANDTVIISDVSDPQNLFALLTKPCMEPRFPRGTILIVSQSITPHDGDLVIAHYPETKSATLREISIDGPTTLLKPVYANNEPDTLTDTIQIIGVVVQSRFNYKN